MNASNSPHISASRFPETEKISPPLLQLSEVTFGYDPSKMILNRVNFDVGLESRIAIVGSNGAGKSTMCVSPRHSYRRLLKWKQNQNPNWRVKSVIGAGEPQRSVTCVSHPDVACHSLLFRSRANPPAAVATLHSTTWTRSFQP
jgi:ABC transporter